MLHFAKLASFLLFCLLAAACSRGAAPTQTSTATPSPTAAPTAIPAPAPGVLSVVPTASLGPVSPVFFGSNYGPWVAVPANMLPAAYDSAVEAIRFPGGNWGDRNVLRPYQIDAFIDFCRQVGAIPTISTRLRDGTAEEAADLVRYTNVDKEYGVEYWSIGNEPSLFAAELQAQDEGADYDTEQFNAAWRASAEAMRAVDPDIKLLGPETHQFTPNATANPKDSAGRDWMIEFLKANGDLVDVVTFHRYPFPRGRTAPAVTVADLRAHTPEWDETIPYLRDLIREHTGRDIPIAVTEVNTHYTNAIGGEATPDSHYNAIWLADSLGRLLRQDVFMFNHWLLAVPPNVGGWGMIARGELRPSYHVYQLYSRFGDELVHAASGVEDVSVYAATREDGALTILVVNLADTEQTPTLQLPDGLPAQAELWRLAPEQAPETSATVSLPAGGALSLPAHSVSLYILTTDGNE